jgi:hypothetical protein
MPCGAPLMTFSVDYSRLQTNRELHVPVGVLQVVVVSPVPNLGGVAIGAAVTVGTAAIVLLQEPLVLALELVVQNDAVHPYAALLAASRGEFELFKTTSNFDSTATNPAWLGEEPERVQQLMPQ